MSRVRRVARGAIATVTAFVVAVSLVSAATAPAANGPVAAPDVAPDQVGRIAFAGTAHRSLGEVANPVPGMPEASTPVFGDGPTHFDDQPAARGDLLVFTSLRDEPTPQVYLRDATGAVRRLTTGRDAAHPQLSPDGMLVAFDSAEPLPGGGTQRVLWSVHTDGTGLRRLTDTTADETSPTFSPDGSRIAFSSTAAGRPQIFVRPVTGGPATQLTAEPTGAAIQPAWNPINDNQIAYVLDADGNTATQQDESARLTSGADVGTPVLTGTRADWQSRSPAWQPDGNGLLFVSDNSDTAGAATTFAQVYVIAGAGDDPSLLLSENRDVGSPTWLVDAAGPHLVVARTTEASPNVAALEDIRVDGSDPRDLGTVVLTEDPRAATDSSVLFNPGPGFDPWTIRQSYSPDGRQLAVSRFEHDGAVTSEEIWISDPDGSNAHVLPIADRKPGDWETDSEWSPDGSMIALARRSPGAINRRGGVSQIIVVKVDTGQVVGRLTDPPGPTATDDEDQPAWSPDGTSLAFSRGTVAGGPDGEPRDQHIWTARVTASGQGDLSFDQQRDLSAAVCAPGCSVTDDSPVFTPDGSGVVFNRENDGLLQVTLADTACRVLLPAGQNSCAGPVTAPTGPFQPRDVAWSPDGKRMVLTTRRTADPNSPEMLALLDPTTGVLTPLGEALPGRQKEPTWENTAHLTLTAPPAVPSVRVGAGTRATATVVSQGPAATEASVTVAVPAGLRLDGLATSQGACDPARLVCDLGVLGPGGTALVTATVTGLVAGDQPVGWSVAGVVLDVAPGGSAAQTVVPVVTPGVPPPPPPPPATRPGVAVVAQPDPAYVGGHTTVRYTVTTQGGATAAGPMLSLGLPAGIPVAARPSACTPTGCALPDLAPRETMVIQVVLAPTAPGTSRITARLTTGNARPASASTTLRVLRPKIVAVPAIGTPGFVTSVRGTDFPPGVPVTLTWTPGITAAAVPTLPGSDGRFIAQLLVLPKDETGPRTITATGAGFAPATTPFLVAPGTLDPPDLVSRH